MFISRVSHNQDSERGHYGQSSQDSCIVDNARTSAKFDVLDTGLCNVSSVSC